MMNKLLPVLQMSTQLSTSYKKETDGEAQPLAPLDPERVEWLRTALAEQLKDPGEEMRKLLGVIRDPSAGEEAVLGALEGLTTWVEHVDFARDLHKMGGLALVLELVERAESREIRIRAAEVIGTCVHNNPEPQKWARELGALKVIVGRIRREDATGTEVAKYLYAVSSLVRGDDLSTLSFLTEHRGFPLICDVVARGGTQNDSTTKTASRDEFAPARRKAAFLLLYLVTRAPKTVSPRSADVVIPALAQALAAGDAHDPDFRQSALDVLTIYLNHQDRVVASIHRPVLEEGLSMAKVAAVEAQHHDDVAKTEGIIAIVKTLS